MPLIDLIIFDCDGVLIDSEVIGCRAEAAALAEIGLAISEEEIAERYVGVSLAQMLADLAARHGRALPEGFAALIAHRTAAAFAAGLRPIPGIEAALDALPHRRCVASSSAPERLVQTLGLVRLLARFAPNVFSASAVARGKPAPDLFLFAAARMEAAPEHCLVVEDSLAGVAAARAAGMRVLGFAGGSHCRPGHGDRLAAAGATRIFSAMAALPGMVEALV